MNPAFDINTLTEYQKIISRLKFNRESYLTKPSRQVIVDTLKRYSTAKLPIHTIGELMTLIYQSKFRNFAIDYLLVKLFYLREYRYIFRLIKKRKHNIKDLMLLMAVADNDTQNMFKMAHIKKIRSHKSFMMFMFTVKASAIMSEMFSLQYIRRYWEHHRPTNNYHHNVIRVWF